MRHPFDLCATTECCFCFTFPPNITCSIIAFLCITINAFSGMTNFGTAHWALYLLSIVNLSLHLAAGVVLFLGAVWKRSDLKLAYCWCVFFGMFTALAGLIAFLVIPNERYIIWGSKCYNFSTIAGVLIVIFHTVWLILFDFYTSLIVLGNTYLGDDESSGVPSRSNP